MRRKSLHTLKRCTGLPERMLIMLLLLVGTAGLTQAQTVSGTVYRDFNGDGVKATGTTATTSTAGYTETGVPGVLVTAYNTSGAVAATAVTSSNTATMGTYTLSLAAGSYRLEFTNFQEGDFDGFKGSGTGTSIQFVTSPATNANLAINYPGNYCQGNPFLITSCYTNGNPKITTGTNLARNDNWLVGWKYNGTPDSRNNYLAKGAVGATWGLAYQRNTQSLYAAAFMKRHSGFGDGGPGQIYKIRTGSPTSASITSTTVTQFVNLSALGINVGTDPRTTTAPASSTPSANYLYPDKTEPNYDVAAFDLVGKMSVGDMDISDDDKTLWVVNLFDRNLYELPLGPDGSAPTSYTMHTLTAPTCVSGVFRPWAVKYYRGKVYVGGVCTGENTTPSTTITSPANASTLQGYVYVHDPAGAQSNFTQVLTFPLNYPRGYATKSGTAAGDIGYAAWRPWIDAWSDIGSGFINISYTQTVYPQPILSDIEFDTNGEMIIGLMDRFGHQSGNANYAPVAGTTAVFEGVSAGDILRAGRNANGTYTLESNATITHTAANGATAITYSSGGKNQTPGQAPGNGEFYWQDMYDKVSDINGGATGHQEIVLGGLAVWAGSGQVAATTFDPNDAFRAAGARYFDNQAGTVNQVYEVLGQDAGNTGNRPASFGKAAGLGDLELLCNPAPVMIGNRVWHDQDNDGMQDPGEPALAGVVVTLKGPGLASGGVSVTTNSSGEYYFTNSAGTAAAGFAYGLNLTSGGSYSICFPTSASALVLSTKANSATTANGDAIDTDADNAGIIRFVLGDAGENNFTYDAAFATVPPCSLTLAVTPGTCQSATNTYAVSGTLTITNGLAQTLVISDDSQATNAVSITVTATASTTAVPFSLTGIKSGTGFHTITVTSSATLCGTTSKTYTAPGGCLLACPGNLLVNASFEQGLPSPPVATTTVTPPPSWTGGLAEMNPTVNFNTPDGYAFAYTSGTSTSMCQSVSANVGSIYTLTFYAGVHQANGQTVTLQFLNGSSLVGTPKAFTITNLLSTNSFGGPYTLISDAAPAGTNLIRVCAAGTGTGGNTDANQWAKVDAMCLTETKTCQMALTVTPGNCTAATNQYAVSGTVSLSNSPATSLTITDGTKSTVVSITAGQTSAAFSLTGLNSGSGNHTVTVISSGTTCGTVSRTYVAPASCSCVTIGSIAPVTVCQGKAVPPVCVTANTNQTVELVLFPQAVSNPYTASGGLHVAEATVTNGTACITMSTTAVPANTGTTSATYVMYVCLKPVPSDPNCQTISLASAVFTVLPAPALTVRASSTLVTAGTPVSLSATGCSGNVMWSTAQSGTVISVTPANPTNVYSATCTTGPGCTTMASVTVNTQPSASLIVVSATVCYGSSATLTASGCANGTVTWSNSTTGTSLITPNLTETTNYTATCTTQAGSATSVVGTATVMPQPVLSLSASSANVTVGTPVNISAVGCAGTVTWSTGESGSVITVTPATASQTYSATCTTGPGCQTTASVTVNTQQAATLTVSSATICYNTSATLTATGCNNGTVSWSNGTTGNSLATPNLTQTTNYTATCTTQTGPATSVIGTVTVQSPVSLTVSRTSVASSTAVTITARGCTNGTLTWSTGAADDGKTSIVVPAAVSSIYTVTCTSGPGCKATGRIMVGSAGANEFTVNDAVICAGQSATLTSTGCLGTINWTGSGVDGQTTASVVVNPAQTTSYTAVCTNGTSVIEVVAQVSITSAPSLTVGAVPSAITPGQSSTLTVAGCLNAALTWSTGAADDGKTSIVVSPTITTGYSVTCTAGPSCIGIAGVTVSVGQSLTPVLSLEKLVNKSKAQMGELLTYTIVVANTGTGPANNVIVRDSISSGLNILPASVTTSVANSFTLGDPISIWNITTLPANSSATIIFSASTMEEGVVYNKAMIPGDTASVCTSIPIKVCKGTNYAIELSAPAGYVRYQWFRRATPVSSETLVYDGSLSSYTATATGEYRVVVNDVQGKCPDLSCCPAIIEEDSIPVFTVLAKSPTCVSNQPQPNGTLTVTGLGNSLSNYSYAVSEGSSFTVANPALLNLPQDGVVSSGLSATKTYTVRIYNQLGCYRDVTVTITVNCACPPEICVPVIIKKTKARI